MWDAIARDNLKSARLLLAEDHFRASINRSYYAVHQLLAGVLTANGLQLPVGRGTQPHGNQAILIRRHLATVLPGWKVTWLQAIARRTLARRLDADYSSVATLDQGAALDSLRRATEAFRILEINP